MGERGVAVAAPRFPHYFTDFERGLHQMKTFTASRFGRRLAIDDEGLGLTEIVVAMFILATLALALLPLLITGMQASVRNTTIAAATQFANDRMAIAQAMASNSTDPCTDIETLQSTPRPR